MTRCAKECTRIFVRALSQKRKLAVPKRRKSVFALKLSRCFRLDSWKAPRRDPETPGFNSAVIADRLDVVIAELAIVDAAIAGSEVGSQHRFGFYSILRKQIDEIAAVRNEVHWPKN